MAINPKERVPPTGTTTTSRYDPRRTSRLWTVFTIGLILVLLVLFWLFGAFDVPTNTATTPAPATTAEGTAVPTAPAAPQ
jgi:hypothetical protein